MIGVGDFLNLNPVKGGGLWIVDDSWIVVMISSIWINHLDFGEIKTFG